MPRNVGSPVREMLIHGADETKVFMKATTWVVVIAILMGTSIASASDWNQVTSEAGLSALVIDTVHSAELKAGVKATSTY